MILTAFLFLFNQRARYRVFIIINLLVSVILVADVVYARYFSDVISIALLRQAKLAAGVQDSVLALVQPRDLAYFLDLCILIPALWRIRRQKGKPASLPWPGRLAILCLLFLVGTNQVQASVASLQERQPGLIRAFWDKQVVANNIGTLNFHAIDFWRYAQKKIATRPLPEEEQAAVAAWFAEQALPTQQKRYHKAMEGKNLILVQLEAFQGFVLNLEINGKEVTPNLNRLAKQSLTFPNAYYQTAMGGTSDAEFLANVSLFPAKDGTAYYEYSANTFKSLPLAAKEKGYATAVMHPFRPGFWNRPSMYKALGFDTYLNQQDFEHDEIFGMGLADHSFYRQAVARMKEMPQPFYTFLISLSSHFPFTDPKVDLRDRLDLGPFAGTLLGNFLLNAHYADEAVGVLIEELKAAQLWDNSVVVFYGDHHAIPEKQNHLLAQLLYDKEELDPVEWQEAQKVVMMMHFPGEEIKGQQTLVAGQIDLFPTLANLLGFDCPYTLGQDLLNADAGFVCFRNGNWLKDEVVHFRTTNEVMDRQTGETLPLADYETLAALAEEKLRISDLTLEHDLIKKWQTGVNE
ncbi:MAG: LTA synthase family protein [Firmicutes bacterium]|nr:LTA synthase family protein [Bacillota bacterium]